MKPVFPPLSRLLLGLTVAALLAPAVRAKDDDSASEGATARVAFSDAAKPGTLKFSLPWAECRITGTDGKEVVVTSSLDQKGRAEVDHEGFRRLDEDVTFELVEKGNVATIVIAGDNAWAAHGAEFEIKVPRNTNLEIHTQAGGDIEVQGVEGDLDINSMNGEITLRDISSSAVVNTMNGEIRATFKHAPTKPVSLSSMNGEIDLRLPSTTKANLRMRTHNGSIRTNFPDGVLKAKTEKSTGRSTPGSVVVIQIQSDGRLTVDDSPVLANLAELEGQLARIAGDKDRTTVRLKAREGADTKLVSGVMDACRKAGLGKITLEAEGNRGDLASVQSELDRELSRADREQAKIAQDVAKEVAKATRMGMEIAREVSREVARAMAEGGEGFNGISMPPIPPMPPLPNFGGKSIVGTLNGGGIDIKLTSMNGTITLRETK